jgi:hypothetical protein
VDDVESLPAAVGGALGFGAIDLGVFGIQEMAAFGHFGGVVGVDHHEIVHGMGDEAHRHAIGAGLDGEVDGFVGEGHGGRVARIGGSSQEGGADVAL